MACYDKINYWRFAQGCSESAFLGGANNIPEGAVSFPFTNLWTNVANE